MVHVQGVQLPCNDQSSSMIRRNAIPTKERRISPMELRAHNTARSSWLLIDGNVYDVTSFLGDVCHMRNI